MQSRDMAKMEVNRNRKVNGMDHRSFTYALLPLVFMYSSWVDAIIVCNICTLTIVCFVSNFNLTCTPMRRSKRTKHHRRYSPRSRSSELKRRSTCNSLEQEQVCSKRDQRKRRSYSSSRSRSMSPKRKKKRHRSNSEHRRKERKKCVWGLSPLQCLNGNQHMNLRKTVVGRNCKRMYLQSNEL